MQSEARVPKQIVALAAARHRAETKVAVDEFALEARDAG
jgi:hypothetical protein